MMERESFFLPKALTLALFALLIAMQGYHLFHTPIWRDDAFFASVAKSIVLGNGYSAVFFDKSYPFNFGISTGPTLILPAALMIAIFGNQYWVPGLVAVIAIDALLILSFFLLRSLLPSPAARWKAACFFLLFALVFTYGHYGIEYRHGLAIWHLLLGEIPSVLLVLCALLVMFRDLSSRRGMAIGGLLFGLAAITKLISVLAFAFFGAALLVYMVWTRRWRDIIPLIGCGLGFLLFPVLWESYKLWNLDLDAYMQIVAQRMNNIRAAGWLTSAHVSNQVTLTPQPLTQILGWLGHVGAFSAALLVGLLIMLGWLQRGRERPIRPIFLLGWLLIGCWLAQLVWWAGFTMGMARYIIHGLFFLGAGLSLLCADLSRLPAERRREIGLLVLLLFLSKAETIVTLAAGLFKPNLLLADMLRARDEVMTLEGNGVTLIACGNNFELEYLLPGNRHFASCEALDGKKPGPFALVSHFVFPGKIIYIDHMHNYARFIPLPEDIATRCKGRFLLQNKHFSIRRCGDTSSQGQP